MPSLNWSSNFFHPYDQIESIKTNLRNLFHSLHTGIINIFKRTLDFLCLSIYIGESLPLAQTMSPYVIHSQDPFGGLTGHPNYPPWSPIHLSYNAPSTTPIIGKMNWNRHLKLSPVCPQYHHISGWRLVVLPQPTDPKSWVDSGIPWSAVK